MHLWRDRLLLALLLWANRRLQGTCLIVGAKPVPKLDLPISDRSHIGRCVNCKGISSETLIQSAECRKKKKRPEIYDSSYRPVFLCLSPFGWFQTSKFETFEPVNGISQYYYPPKQFEIGTKQGSFYCLEFHFGHLHSPHALGLAA